jgi:hypothetical protein
MALTWGWTIDGTATPLVGIPENPTARIADAKTTVD